MHNTMFGGATASVLSLINPRWRDTAALELGAADRDLPTRQVSVKLMPSVAGAAGRLQGRQGVACFGQCLPGDSRAGVPGVVQVQLC